MCFFSKVTLSANFPVRNIMRIDLSQHDLVTPDGKIVSITKKDDGISMAEVVIEHIHSSFVGFDIDPALVTFNIKSTLAQLGINGIGMHYELHRGHSKAMVLVELRAIGSIGRELLQELPLGAYIGKLFAADERRRVRDPIYLSRMFGRSDRWGRPLLSLGGLHGSDELILDKIDGRTVAYLALKRGKITYDASVFGFLRTLAKGLTTKHTFRELLQLHQEWNAGAFRNVEEDEILLVKTQPLHIRTVFAKVVDSLLAAGYCHTTASVLQPDTRASGDIYEFYGKSKREITDLPLEFYTLDPYREHVFFADRDQLQACLEDPQALFKAFETAPKPTEVPVATFVVKGSQLLSLAADDWVARESTFHDFPGITHGARQAFLVERYIESQAVFPFLKAIEEGRITSQGVLFLRYFPSPMMKRMLLSAAVARSVQGIYFQHPSRSYGGFFSQEDRALLTDLHKFAIGVFWVDAISGKILQYMQRKDRESGMFVPIGRGEEYMKATVFGVYGSNLISGHFEEELQALLKGVLELRNTVHHPLLQKDTPLALITGGGPGAMEVGNRIARKLNILSCANIADFHEEGGVVNEQKQNPYVDAKMTYRLKQLVERQSEFNLDFPIFVMGGIGTDFEFTLEEVRRKVGATAATPVLLFGEIEYWKSKITPRFLQNKQSGTIVGSEWVSNCFFCIQKATQGLEIYSQFFHGTLPIGKNGAETDVGFVCP